MDTSHPVDDQSRGHRRSRKAYTLECAFEYFVAILVSDTVLPYLLTEIGMPDSLSGITTSIISLSFLFQLFAVGVAQKVRNTKRFGTLFHCFGQLFFMCIYLVPFLPIVSGAKHILVIVCLVVAYFGNYLVTNIIYKWGNSYVEPSNRGRFSATKEIISLLSGMVVSLAVGVAMDAFKKAGNPKGAFLFAAIGILAFVICDFICLMLIQNDVRPKNEAVEKIPLREALSATVGNKNYRNVIFLNALWSCAVYSMIPFLGTYRIKELAFTMSMVQAFAIIACLVRAALSLPFGRYADRRSYAKGVELGMLLAAIGFAANIFTTPETRYLVLFFTVMYNACLAGVSGSMSNITYSYVDSKYFVQAAAIRGSISGVCGFLASLGAGKLLDVIQANGNTFLGIHVYGQQVLSAISLLLIIAAILFNRFVIEKQSVMRQ